MKQSSFRGNYMVDKLTMQEYAELPDIILDNSKNVKYIQLLSEKTVKYYYYSNLKKDLMIEFNKFKDSKHIIALSNDFSLKSSMGNLNYSNTSPSKNDKVGNFIQKKIDLNIWSRDIYGILVNLSKELTFNEALYLVATFFEDKTEENICELLGICIKSLYKIKRSCLVKIKLEFDKYNFLY